MFRSSFFMSITIVILMILLTNGKNITSRRPGLSSNRKPVSIKICGLALVRMLDMVCTRARQLLMGKGAQSASLLKKRQFNFDDNPYSQTLSFTDYAQFNDTLVGDCCLQACTLKILLKYC